MKKLGRQKTTEKKQKEFIPVSLLLDENMKTLKNIFQDCSDVVYREFRLGQEQEQKMFIVFLDGMINQDVIEEHILKSLMLDARRTPPALEEVKEKMYELILEGGLSAADVKESDNLDEGILGVLSGDTIIFIDGIDRFLITSTKGWPTRGIDQPSSESVIRGAREGFVETFRVNTVLLRRKIRDPKFKIKSMQIGKRSKTDIGIAYIEDITRTDILQEVEKRLEAIDIDAVLESGYIEQLIEDSWISLFPQIQHSERPDTVAAALLEGRVAIIIDNTPFVLVVPVTLNTFLLSSEDYYERWWVANFVRWVRMGAVVISFLLPAVYIAIASYHPGIIPSQLAIFIAGTRETVPFPVFMEALLMEFTFELLREAGVRLPSQMGSTIGIVGSLIIGQAAVEAGLVSPIMVIIVAVTAISSFAIPSYNLSISFRLLRFTAMAAASFLGLYGLILVVILVLVHLASLTSFGVPYLIPLAPFKSSEIKDTLVKAPLLSMKNRPEYTAGGDKKRMGDGPREEGGQEEINQPPQGKNSVQDQGMDTDKNPLKKFIKPIKLTKEKKKGGEDDGQQ